MGSAVMEARVAAAVCSPTNVAVLKTRWIIPLIL